MGKSLWQIFNFLHIGLNLNLIQIIKKYIILWD